MKIRILLAALLAFLATPLAGLHAATAGKFDGYWQITITDGTFHINYDGIVEDQPYTGSPGSITVTKGKVSGNTYGGQTSYSGTVSNGGAGSFTITVGAYSTLNFTGTFSGNSASGTFNETRTIGTAEGHWTAKRTKDTSDSGGSGGGGSKSGGKSGSKGGGKGGGKGGSGGGDKPKKDKRSLTAGWYYFTTQTLNTNVDDSIHATEGYAFLSSTPAGGVIRAVFVPPANLVSGATYSPGPPPYTQIGDTSPGTVWGALTLAPGAEFTAFDKTGTSYEFRGQLSWVANLTAVPGIGSTNVPQAASWPIGTVSGWDGVQVAFIFASPLLETAVSGASGNMYGLSYYSGASAPPLGSLALAGSAAPDAAPAKKTYAVHGSSATITGKVYSWPSKLKLHVQLTGGHAHARATAAKWSAEVSLPHAGKYTLTTWFTDSAGLRGKKVRTKVVRAK